jgi:hypothetical protein
MFRTAPRTIETALIAESGAVFCGFLALAVLLLQIFAAVH